MADFEYHSLIEFVNRTFTGVVTIAVVLAVLGSLRRTIRRGDLVWLSWGLVAGVVAQIVLGGLLVKTDLDPRFAMGHFLLSMVLLWNAVVLQDRASIPDDISGAGRATPPSSESGLIRRRLRVLMAGVSVVGATLLVTGTIVTGSGPHSGSDDPDVAERLPFLVRSVTRIHSATAMAVLLLIFVVGWIARRHHLSSIETQAETAGVLMIIQGSLGYLQYFMGVPVLLVGIHIALASLTWISIVRLHLVVLRDGSVPPVPTRDSTLAGSRQP